MLGRLAGSRGVWAVAEDSLQLTGTLARKSLEAVLKVVVQQFYPQIYTDFHRFFVKFYLICVHLCLSVDF